jgi:lipid-binding SYLF domain-containing protein
MKMSKSYFGIARFFLMVFAILPLGMAQAESAKVIDVQVGEAVEQFRKTVKGAGQYLEAAKGVLVIPEVKKAGLIVGGQWGEGALKVDGKTVSYYQLQAASVGFQAGYQTANYMFIFLTNEALNEFRKAKGWGAGFEGGVTVVDESIGFSLDTLKAKSSVIAFIYGKEGLMAGGSLKGQKLTEFVLRRTRFCCRSDWSSGF